MTIVAAMRGARVRRAAALVGLTGAVVLSLAYVVLGGGAESMAVSRSMEESVRFNKTRVTGLDWVTYPILRFKDAPKVTTVVVQRKEHVPLGAGEPPTVGIGSAVANAFFDATGVRIRQAPMNPATVRHVLKDAGVA